MSVIAKLPPSILSETTVICAGEDPKEVVDAFQNLIAETPNAFHEFRFYQCRKFSSFSLINCGIGTGCLEPLLHEIFQFQTVKRLILIGSAGLTSSSSCLIGEPYFIKNANIAGSPLSKFKTESFRPNFTQKSNLPTASIVSCDFFYGFSPEGIPELAAEFQNFNKTADLIDMETGQFYAICSKLAKQRPFEFIAIKGPANSINDFSTMNKNAVPLFDKLAFWVLEHSLEEVISS